jgi:16S rRNA (uracil1498-N3)-methyltransferase
LLDSECSFLTFRIQFKSTPNLKLNDAEISHLKSLRIFSENKNIEIRDGLGKSYIYKCEALSKDLKLVPGSEKDLPIENRLVVAGAIPKGNRLDWLLQKGTEIGVTEFWFCNFPRSSRLEFSQERSVRIVTEAGIQSKRSTLPIFRIFSSPLEMIQKNPNETFFFLDPRSEKPLIASKIHKSIPIIGPEGGLGELESDFKNLGLKGYFLGENILRIETAFVYLSVVLAQVDLEKNSPISTI